MIDRFFYQYKHFRKKYSNYELIMKVINKVYEKLYYSIEEFIVTKKKFDLSTEYFGDFRPSSEFFFDSENKNYYIQYLDLLNLDGEIILQANEICDHKFDLLGSGKIFLGERINWHKDFKSNYVWTEKYFKKITTVDLSNNADVKVPWELSRFQHISTLGQAYWLTNNKKYILEFKDQIEDWIENNPFKMGVNWTCTMDVSIRIVNWIIGYYYFKESELLESTFWNKYFMNLYLAGKFISKNLENDVDGHGNNHYLSNLVGLIWLGLFFNNFDKKTESWLDEGVKKIIIETKYQVNAEGTDFEASIPYHRLVTELLLSTTILVEKKCIKFPNEFKETLEKMCEFVMYYTKHNGLAPQIGDADDGRLFVLTHYGVEDKRDHRHLLGVAGEYFDRDDFRYAAGIEKMDGVWLTGKFKSHSYYHDNIITTKAYNDMGYYIIRDKMVFMIIRCGGVGQAGMGGHSHNDQLSMEIQIDGKDIFIDPGTFVYTSNYSERNLFRSTNYHNTMLINNEEQNKIDERQLFRLFDNTQSKLITFEKNCDEVIFVGEHRGYFDNHNIIYTREVNYNFTKKRIIIKDSASKIGDCRINWFLSDQVSVVELENSNLLLNSYVKVKFDNKPYICDTYISPSYGKKVKSKKISVFTSQNNITTIEF